MCTQPNPDPGSAATFPEPPQSVNLGNLLAEAFDRFPVTQENGDFERPPQGDHPEPVSFDD